METLRLLVQNLIIIVVLAVFLEMLLPIGDMKKYVRMVMGLMVIVAVLQALNGFSGGGLFKEIEEYAFRSPPEEIKKMNILEQGRGIEGENRKKALEQYRKGIERQVSSLAAVDGKIKATAVNVKLQDDPSKKDFGKIIEVNLLIGKGEGQTEGGVKPVEPVTVKVGQEKTGFSEGDITPPEYSEAARRAADKVANFYNLSPDNISIKFK